MSDEKKAWIDAQPARRCRGRQEQDLEVVTARIGREGESAKRRAGNAQTQARADELTRVADSHLALLERVSAAAEALAAGEPGEAFDGLEGVHFEDQPRDGERERVRTGRVIQVLIAAGEPQAARALDAIARTPCGADLNAAIAELPVDGEQHYFDCPSCGVEHHATRMPPAPAPEEEAA